MNKYNLKVGDFIKAKHSNSSSSVIKFVGEKGISLLTNNEAGLNWEEVNSSIDKGDWILTRNSIKKELPTKFSVFGGKELEEFLKEDIIDRNGHAGNADAYYHIRNNKVINYNYSNFIGELLTVEQIKEYMKEETKEIIGYKLIKPEYKEIALTIANEGIHSVAKIKEEDLNFVRTSPLHNLSLPKLKKAGVLDLWFTPIYKEQVEVGDYVIASYGNVEWCKNVENIFGKISSIVLSQNESYRVISEDLRNYNKTYNYAWFKEVRKATAEEIEKNVPKEIKLTLGDKKVEFTISKEGIKADGKSFTIKEVQNLYNSLTGSNTIGGYKILHDNVKIGCTTFKVSEILKIIESYNQLQNA